MPPIAEYDCRQDGGRPSARTLALLTTRSSLLARAAVRRAIADQDRAAGDTHAEWRNRMVAMRMTEAAAKAEI